MKHVKEVFIDPLSAHMNSLINARNSYAFREAIHINPSSRIVQCSLVSLLLLSEHIRVLLKRASRDLVLLPQVGGQETICAGDSDEGSLERVLERLG